VDSATAPDPASVDIWCGSRCANPVAPPRECNSESTPESAHAALRLPKVSSPPAGTAIRPGLCQPELELSLPLEPHWFPIWCSGFHPDFLDGAFLQPCRQFLPFGDRATKPTTHELTSRSRAFATTTASILLSKSMPAISGFHSTRTRNRRRLRSQRYGCFCEWRDLAQIARFPCSPLTPPKAL
jgi:hypothetical protein